MEALGDVVEEISDAALRIRTDDDAQRPPVGQIPDLLARLDRLIGGEEISLSRRGNRPARATGRPRAACRGSRNRSDAGRRRRDRATRAGDRRNCGRRDACGGRIWRLRSKAGRACAACACICRSRSARIASICETSVAMPAEPMRHRHIDDVEQAPLAGGDRRGAAAPDRGVAARLGGGFARRAFEKLGSAQEGVGRILGLDRADIGGVDPGELSRWRSRSQTGSQSAIEQSRAARRAR